MIRSFVIGLLSTLVLPAMLACDKLPDPGQPRQEQNEGQENQGNNNSEGTDMPETIKITVSGATLPVRIENNAATRALVAALREAPITYEAHDYGGFEKVGALGRSLPASDTQITTQAGDVILYSGDQIVLFYGSNSWAYTRLGHITDQTPEQMEQPLGHGDVTITLTAE